MFPISVNWKVVAVLAAIALSGMAYWKFSGDIRDYFTTKCDNSKLIEASKADNDLIKTLLVRNAALQKTIDDLRKAEQANKEKRNDNVKKLDGLEDGPIAPVLRKSLDLLDEK